MLLRNERSLGVTVPTTTVWSQLKIGAGGLISGIDIAADGTKVCRTDTYGAYLRVGSVWQQMLSTLTMPAADAGVGSGVGVYEIRIAPSNTSRFYMIYNGYVFRSDNKGAAWTRTARAQDTSADPNNNFRGACCKIAIDPQNPDFVLVTTPTAGVSWSDDAGATWHTIGTGSIPASGNGSLGTPAGYLVSCDPSSAVVGGKKQGWYVSSYGHGVYHSPDAGATWAHITSSPNSHSAMVVDPNGIPWFVDSSVTELSGVLYKYSGSGNWPSSIAGAGAAVTPVAIDPSHVGVGSTHVYVADFNGNLVVSLDSGATWVPLTSKSVTTAAGSPPWIATYSAANGNALSNHAGMMFDASGVLWLGTGLGTANVTPPTTNVAYSWAFDTQGIEQLVANWAVSPPSGVPIVAAWDQGVFRSADPTVYPSTHGTDLTFAAGWSCDYASAAPGTIVALTNWNGNDTIGKSADGGQTWTKFSAIGTPPPFQSTTGGNIGGNIAAASATNFVMVRTDNGTNPNQPYYTTDGGATWHAITMTGVPTSGTTGWNPDYFFWCQTLCADRGDPNTFYIHNNGSGTGNTGGGVWKSTDGGATWAKVSTSIMGGATALNARMRTVPSNAGHLFRSSGANSGANFERSTDHGATWSSVANVTEVWAFGFGKAKPGGAYPAIFIAGYVNSVWGAYRSDDNAVSWISLGLPLNSFDQVKCVEGDPNTYGTVYVGLQGSGFAYGALH